MTTVPETVLLVDDEPAVLNVLVMAFKKAEVPVQTAKSAEDAMVLLETGAFAAVVTDKNLPGKSGIDLLRYVNEHRPDCARIVITGFANTESALEALRLGADDYLLKPFEKLSLVVERVKHAIEHRRVLAERRALSAALHVMEDSLRKSESDVFSKGTELDLLQNVLELKIEDATGALTARVAELERQLAQARATLKELAAQQTDEALKKRLLAEVEILS